MGFSYSLLSYMILMRPFQNKVDYFFEVLNEATILYVSYFLIVFTEYITDPEVRYNIGWLQISIISLNIVFNWVNLLLSLFLNIYKKLKPLCIKIANKLKPLITKLKLKLNKVKISHGQIPHITKFGFFKKNGLTNQRNSISNDDF